MKKYIFLGAFLIFSAYLAVGQSQDAKLMKRQVFQVLSGPHVHPNDSISKLIHGGYWEALAYREDGWDPTDEFVEEGVPDQYFFQENGQLKMRFYDPVERGQYSPDVLATYTIDHEQALLRIYLQDFPDIVFQEMKVLYCSSEYLALRWEGLSVFFTRKKAG
jgi:hypothetical protein